MKYFERVQVGLYLLGTVLVLHPLVSRAAGQFDDVAVPFFQMVTVAIGLYMLYKAYYLERDVMREDQTVYQLVGILFWFLALVGPVSVLLSVVSSLWLNAIINLGLTVVMLVFLYTLKRGLYQLVNRAST